MKKLFAMAALGATCLAGAAEAQAAEVQFIGRLVVTNIAGTCPSDPTGQRVTARWRPAGIGDNGADTNFAYFRPTQAVAFKLTGSFDGTLRAAKTMIVAGTFGPPDISWRISFNTISPATITETTKFVNVTGKIKGYDFMPDCVANFRFAGVNRVGD